MIPRLSSLHCLHPGGKIEIGIVGSGVVGKTLAEGLINQGHYVMVGSRNPEKLKAWQSDFGPGVRIGGVAHSAVSGDMVGLAAKGTAAEEALKLVGTDLLFDKTELDATNPIAEEEPIQGFLKFCAKLEESSADRMQKLGPRARFVKAFNIVGAAFLIGPHIETSPN